MRYRAPDPVFWPKPDPYPCNEVRGIAEMKVRTGEGTDRQGGDISRTQAGGCLTCNLCKGGHFVVEVNLQEVTATMQTRAHFLGTTHLYGNKLCVMFYYCHIRFYDPLRHLYLGTSFVLKVYI